ncbi:Short-chain dehydrogenase/reductase [Lachnellula occidentalis]|uniref:Short-chain dehydrogenase/reductase n=1 Tax=Lachnellula occidentalis TaxID=215460 RepID=A0A8H8UJ59_9HELO|nr:Short-chain dehydrogenase/reductase [Lachnellula occidentalis]
MEPSSQTIVLITGANQGVGFYTAKNLALHSSKYHVLLASRDSAKGADAESTLKDLPDIKGTVEAIQLDVTNDASVDAAAAKVFSTHGRLDVLVNNAGILSKNPTARDNLREVLAVNCVGVMSVTEAFLPLLRKSSAPRLVFVSSSIGSITHASNPESPYYRATGEQYRMSKAALNMLMNQYHVKLASDGFKVFGADPGLVVTNLADKENQRARGGVEGDVGGERVATVVRGDRDADVGKVCGVYGVCPW